MEIFSFVALLKEGKIIYKYFFINIIYEQRFDYILIFA